MPGTPDPEPTRQSIKGAIIIMNIETKIHIGIDVSKPILDVYVLPNNKYMQFNNDLIGIKQLIKKISKFSDNLLSSSLIVMESTGGYEKLLAITLQQAGCNVCIMNPKRIRDFAKSMGKLAKTDKIDAQVIALFACKMEPSANFIYNEETKRLSESNMRRQQLISLITMEKNRLDKASPIYKKNIERVIKFLTKQLDNISEEQQKLIESNKEFSEKVNLLTTIKGVGNLTAGALLAELPELGTLGSKQVTSLAGLAPFNQDSGKYKGLRIICGGRASVRRTLYMSTLTATQHNPLIRAFYQRLLAAGKKKKVALTACMRKLLIIMNVMIKNKSMWKNEVLLQS